MNKKLQLLVLFLSIGICTTILAQTSQSNFINYQGVASNTAGEVMADQSITVGIALKYGATAAVAYAENHTVTTDANGVFSLKIGSGTATTGTYANFQWDGIATFVTVTVNGTEIGTTELLAVPYAITSGDNRWSQNGDDIENLNTGIVQVTGNLEVGANIQLQLGPAANEISTDGSLAGNSDKAIPTEKAVKTFVEANSSTGLRRYTNDGNTGWNLIGMSQSTWIGQNGIDLSSSIQVSPRTGALGTLSVAMGDRTRASGEISTAMGSRTTASGENSTAMGGDTKAESFSSLAIGRYNIGGGNTTTWIEEDPLFEIGNGSSSGSNNALTILKNGKVGIGRHTPTSLLEVAHQDGSPSSADRTNAFSIRNLGTGRSWQMYTEDNGYLLLFNDGNYRGSFNAATGAYGSVSDRRVKKDIISLSDGTLQKVLQLNPVSYLMKSQKDKHRNLGLISQEVKEIFPSITHYVKEKDLIELSYTELIPVLIKALQEQQTIIEGQNTKINGLSTEVGQIKTILKKLSLSNSIASKE